MAIFSFSHLIFIVVIAFLYTRLPGDIWPVAVEWTQNLQKDGVFAPNKDLVGSQQFAKGNIQGPETIVFSPKGEMLAFTEYGTITEVHPDGTTSEWLYTGGRPIAGTFDKNGDLIVCDIAKGLLKIDTTTKEITVLSVRSDDDKLQYNFIDDVDIAPDGKIYFSDASQIPPHRYRNGLFTLVLTSLLEAMEGRKTGRLIEYDPETKKSRTLINGLFFANGVVVAQDGSYVLINETFDKRIWRYWLKGDKKGTKELFTDTLPAMVDGISQASNGNYWVAGVSIDQEPGFNLISKVPALKSLVAKIFLTDLPKLGKHAGCIFEVDPQGQVVRTLYDPKGESVWGITSVTEHRGKLYLGSFNDFIGVKTLE
jgi:sugar lactone lactonase YvrE